MKSMRRERLTMQRCCHPSTRRWLSLSIQEAKHHRYGAENVVPHKTSDFLLPRTGMGRITCHTFPAVCGVGDSKLGVGWGDVLHAR